MTFEVTGFETGRRFRGMLYLAAALVVLVALTVSLFPSIQESGEATQEYIENLPPEVRQAFVGGVTDITTVEGYLASQLYQNTWLLLLALYYAYAGGSLVAGDVESGVVQVVLVHPVTRTRLVVGKFLSLATSVVLVNALTYLAVYAGVLWVGSEIDPTRLLAIHAYAVPYLLAATGLGLLWSVQADTARRAQVLAIGTVFGMFMTDVLTLETDYEWVGDVSITRYFDVAEILVEETIAWGDLAVLVVATVALVVVSAELFERRDVG